MAKREAKIRSRPGSTAASVVAAESTGTDCLSDAITSLPEILKKKANLEAHTSILQAVMREMAAREVHAYFELEQTILLSEGSVDKVSVPELLRDGNKGNIEDKARLLTIVTLLSTDKSPTTAEDYARAFEEGCRRAQPAREGYISIIILFSSYVRTQHCHYVILSLVL